MLWYFISTSLKTKQVKLHFFTSWMPQDFNFFIRMVQLFISQLICGQHLYVQLSIMIFCLKYSIITSECSWKRSNGVDCRRTRSVGRRCWLSWLLIVLSYLCQNYERFYFYNKNFSMRKKELNHFVRLSFLLKHVLARLFIVAHQQNMLPFSLFVTSWKFCWKIFVPNIN